MEDGAVTFVSRHNPDKSLCVESSYQYKQVAKIVFENREELVGFCSLNGITLQPGTKEPGAQLCLLRAGDRVCPKLGVYTLVPCIKVQTSKQSSKYANQEKAAPPKK